MADLSSLRTNYQNVLAEQLKKGLGQVGNVYAGRGTTGGGEEAYAMGQLGQQYGQGMAQNELGLQQLEQQGQQFGQTLGEQQRQFNVGQGNWGQQFGLQSELGRGGLGLQQQQLTQQGQQFGQSLAEQQAGRLFGQGISQAGLTGQYQGQATQPYLQQQFANQLAQAGLTGQYQGQQTLAGLQNAQQFGLAQGQLTGQYGGSPTQSYINQMLPYITGGYMKNPWAEGENQIAIQTEQQLSPEYQYAGQMGLNPYQMALMAQINPDKLKELMGGTMPKPSSTTPTGILPTGTALGPFWGF